MIPWLRPGAPFPPINEALDDPNGLLAAGGELAPERLLDAYRHGIFPWYSSGQPVLWWSPDPRTVLFIDEFKVSRSLQKTLRHRPFQIRIDTAFGAVIEGCAEPRGYERGTWITPTMIEAYTSLHRMGYAHSVEAWRDGQLAGGLYGVAIGRMFFGESMFARESNASKVALVSLITLLRRLGYPLIDCQQQTAHLARFGARPIPRRQFAELLSRLVHSSIPSARWAVTELAETGNP